MAKTVAGNQGVVQVRVVEQHLSMEEIFTEVAFRLETEEKTSEAQRSGLHESQIHKTSMSGESKRHFKSQDRPRGGVHGNKEMCHLRHRRRQMLPPALLLLLRR